MRFGGTRRPGLDQLYRDFADRWDIEPIAPGMKWIGVLRETGGGHIIVAFSPDIAGLRSVMTRAERAQAESTRIPDALMKVAEGEAMQEPAEGTDNSGQRRVNGTGTIRAAACRQTPARRRRRS